MAALTDGELQHKTAEFKERLAKKATLDELLPEAFAAIREAAKRVLGMFPYDKSESFTGRWVNCFSVGNCGVINNFC